MGKTYREAMEELMRKYDAVWDRAFREFERYGSITDETDDLLSQLEQRIAMMEA